jgi:hypothetical protein
MDKEAKPVKSSAILRYSLGAYVLRASTIDRYTPGWYVQGLAALLL